MFCKKGSINCSYRWHGCWWSKQGHWSPDADSEPRRLALLPQTPPLTWDELMHHGAYQHALERLP